MVTGNTVSGIRTAARATGTPISDSASSGPGAPLSSAALPSHRLMTPAALPAQQPRQSLHQHQHQQLLSKKARLAPQTAVDVEQAPDCHTTAPISFLRSASSSSSCSVIIILLGCMRCCCCASPSGPQASRSEPRPIETIKSPQVWMVLHCKIHSIICASHSDRAHSLPYHCITCTSERTPHRMPYHWQQQCALLMAILTETAAGLAARSQREEDPRSEDGLLQIARYSSIAHSDLRCRRRRSSCW